jgi:hypothetical protein
VPIFPSAPDFCLTQGQRTPTNQACKVTEVMEQKGANCLWMSGLEGTYEETGRTPVCILGRLVKKRGFGEAGDAIQVGAPNS